MWSWDAVATAGSLPFALSYEHNGYLTQKAPIEEPIQKVIPTTLHLRIINFLHHPGVLDTQTKAEPTKPCEETYVGLQWQVKRRKAWGIFGTVTKRKLDQCTGNVHSSSQGVTHTSSWHGCSWKNAKDVKWQLIFGLSSWPLQEAKQSHLHEKTTSVPVASFFHDLQIITCGIPAHLLTNNRYAAS